MGAPPPERGFTALSIDELAAVLGSRTRALRAREWLYGETPLPPELPERVAGVTPRVWAALRAEAPLPQHRLVSRESAPDGTTKLVLELGGGARVETVVIPGPGRSTVCVSSQAGCTRRCAFCATASLGFGRQLSTAEIVLQYALARRFAPAGAPARNVVFMGMGEPMDNLDQVLPAVERFLENPCPALGTEHVTVSTAGVAPGMERFLGASQALLALSLNATNDEQRERLMPHNARWPIATLLDVLRRDAAVGSGRRYFVGYVLFDGENDSNEDARRLAGLLSGLPAHVNLIPHNPWPGNPYRPSPPERVLGFQAVLRAAGVRCLIRWPRGREIAAACGQLALLPPRPEEPA